MTTHWPEKRTSGLSCITDGAAEEASEVFELMRERFERHPLHPSQFRDTPDIFVTPSPAQTAIIRRVLTGVDGFISRWGGTPIPLRPAHIYLSDATRMPPEYAARYERTGAYYAIGFQAVNIMTNMMRNNLQLAHTLGHECMHFCAFHSYRLTQTSKPDVWNWEEATGGLIDFPAGQSEHRGFWLDEAVTETLARRFGASVLTQVPELIAELDVHRQLYRQDPQPEIGPYISAEWSTLKGYPGKWSVDYARPSVYVTYRLRLQEVMKDILTAHAGSFSDVDEVFDVFARAYFTGDRTELIGLTESTFGAGAFSRLQEEDVPDDGDTSERLTG